MGDATGGVSHDVTGGVMGDALSRTGSPEPFFPDPDAPSGRSPAGCRQAPTGSRGLAKGSDAAPATSKPRLSKQERDQVQAVRALLPRELDTRLGDRLPPNVSAAIVTALAMRPAQGTVPAAARHPPRRETLEYVLGRAAVPGLEGAGGHGGGSAAAVRAVAVDAEGHRRVREPRLRRPRRHPHRSAVHRVRHSGRGPACRPRGAEGPPGCPR